MAMKRSSSLTRAATVLAVAAALPIAAQAAEKSVVVRDAETGQLRAPTAEEARALQGSAKSERASARTLRGSSAAAASTAVEQVTATGAIALELDESTHMYSVARRNADGSITRECVQGQDKALASLAKPANFAKPVAAKSVARTARGAAYEDK
jgi:hypothetical protein